MQSGEEPDYATVPAGAPTRSADELKADLAQANETLMRYLSDTYGAGPLDTPVNCYGRTQPFGYMVNLLVAEEGYHSGQAAFIRMATDPTWDYYAAVYG